VDQARKLKELEQENAKLKRLVSELSLEKLVEGHRLGKLLSLDRRRCAVDPGCELHGMSERGARRVVKQLRGTQRYRPTQRDDEDTLTQAIVTLASQYGRYGYRRITALLRRAGWQEVQVLSESWRVHYNTIRPHASLGYRSPVPEAWALQTTLHTPSGSSLDTSKATQH
jgi:transposase InsO family protein